LQTIYLDLLKLVDILGLDKMCGIIKWLV